MNVYREIGPFSVVKQSCCQFPKADLPVGEALIDQLKSGLGHKFPLAVNANALIATMCEGPGCANGGRATSLMDIRLETTLDMHLGSVFMLAISKIVMMMEE